MTLKGKNRYTFVLCVFFLTFSICALAFFVLRLKHILNTDNLLNLYSKNLLFLKQGGKTFIFSSACMLLYVPIFSFHTYSHFLKTPATETIYFMFFLLGCNFELLRFLIPLEVAQNTMPFLLVATGRAIFCGRAICFSSLFVAAVAGSPEQRINAEQNLFMILVFSLVLAATVPVNTLQITTNFNMPVGMNSFINFFYGMASALTFFCFAIKAYHSENKSYAFLGVEIVFIEMGFVLLNFVSFFVAKITGCAIFFVATFLFLKRLHRLYG